MAGKLELAEQKMIRKIKASKQKWLNAVKSTDTLDQFIDKIVESSDGRLTRAQVEKSIPVKNFKDFQANAEDYVDVMINNAVKAVENGRWRKGWLDAFKAPAE